MRTSVRLANMRWLGQARRPGLVSPELRAAVLEAWRPGCTIGHLATTVHARRGGGEVALAAVLHALWWGWLVTDLSQPLDGTSVLHEGVPNASSLAH